MTTAQRPRLRHDAPPLTVASVPSGHVYVRHLAPLEGQGAQRLPDPDPSAPGRPSAARWWPPVMLKPDWVREAPIDVFHLHFGFDSRHPSDLVELVDALRRRSTPFVFTIHDLRNPHHEDRRIHDEQLDVLVPAADALVTLTPGAAREIHGRWGRQADVVPHPHVVDLPTIAKVRRQREAAPRGEFRVGLHLKSLRASMDPLRILPTLVETIADLEDAVLQVNGHRDVLDPDGARHHPELADWLRREEEAGGLELHVHDFFSDAQLWDYLSSLDVSVLPYRFGTHSGWLEACRDLQTTVVAPSCGYFTEQGQSLSYVHDEESFDPGSLQSAIVHAHQHRPRLGASVEERTTQRHAVAEAHERLYRRLVG